MTLLADFREARRLGKLPLPVVKVGSTFYYAAEEDADYRRYNILRNQLMRKHSFLSCIAVKIGYL